MCMAKAVVVATYNADKEKSESWKDNFFFVGIDTLPQFSNWILGEESKAVTCIANNFGGYDGQFITHYILEFGTVIMNGNTILRMKIGHVTFFDSYQFYIL